MSKAKFGVHLPNGPIADPEKMLGMGVANFTLLHHQADWLPRLRQASPRGILLVRMYLSKWSDRDARDWARECARIYHERGLSRYEAHVTPANEMNLPEEGGGWSYDHYDRINHWLLEWVDEFYSQTSCPIDRVHFPAFAYGHSDDQSDYGYSGMEICRPAIHVYGVLDVHPYWFEPGQVTSRYFGHRFEIAHELFPDKPIFCSEAGNFDVMRESTPDEMIQWFESLDQFSYVLGGTPFIWEDPTGAHPSNDWSRNPKIAERVKMAQGNGAASEPGIILGPGFQRVRDLVQFQEPEQWHFASDDRKTSLAVGAKGYATWHARTNRLVVVLDNGRILADGGNQSNVLRELR